MNHYTSSPRLRLLLAAVFCLLACSQAHAQVAVRLQMNKSNYLLNEPVTATITITNHAGRQLVLAGNANQSWLSFQMTSGGRVVPPARRMAYKPAVIPAGQSISRVVSLTTSYALGNMGNYTCSASVRMPGPAINGFTSNRVHFTVTGGRTAWLQRAGIPGAPGEIREYKLITFSANRGMELYADVASKNTGRNIATIPLGKILSFRNPTATLDGKNNMHALYQVKPDLFTHTAVSPSGQVLATSYHKRGASGDPRLMTFANGEVRVAGSIPYQPEVEAAQKRKIHNISERPPFIYR
ncbi:hypothetical protein NT6N_27510 [Oceaniferula spumae]|uniref:BACON domain-containing protein n=1 Tax=Oceaniferula spumae TaxID=2979115 RepID=A0AAT9FP76_9BACT